MAVYAVNNTVGPEGLCPTLCIFGILPRPARKSFAPNQVARAKAIDDAMIEVDRYQCKRKLEFSKSYKGPMPGEREDLNKLKFGDEVLVYRQKSKTREGPFRFINKGGETVCVEFPHGRRIF